MATQVPYGHPQGGWNHAPQQLPPAEQDDSGVQVRPMGLKVQYTLNSEDRNNYLARYPHPLQIQTMTDESNTIGVVDLRICVEAITTCSPELSSHENDYTIYATDYSEPDSPLVGQGLLSWALDTMRPETASQHVPQLITGVVRKNKLGLLRGGGETLEVKLKLTTAVKVQRPPDRSVEQPRPVEIPHGRPMDQPLTPTGSAEWSSFIQSNPHIGQQRPQSQSQPPHPQYHQPNHSSRVASPALSQGPPPSLHDRHDSFGPGFPPQNPPQNPSPNPAHSQPHTTAQELPKLAPLTAETAQMLAQQGVNTSRPSSRASNKAPARKKTATGRPRGRPRKKAAEGNTSGYEDGTEGEDAPMKKRAKTTKVDQANENAFISGPDSLRVAASTSGSLRSFRPVGSGGDGAQGNHLQEVPRAPTPVPDASLGGQRQSVASNLRRISTMNRSSLPQPTESQASMSPPNDDARSPNSNAPTPAYSGDESAADIASSPPLPRATPYIRSSPPPSSPVLPPMPQPQMSREPSTVEDDMDDLFGENPDMGEMLPENAPQPTRSSKGLCNKKKVPERTTVSNIPMQVFRMEPGPDGADMVHIRNLNTPEPSSMPAGPPEPSYLPHPRIQPNLPQPLSETQQAAPQQSTTLAPTPPSTTDAIEPSTTPQPAPETETGNSKGPDHKEEPVPDRAPEENTQGAGSASKEREQIQPIAVQDEPAAPSAKPAKPKPRSRKLARSQSAGILALPIPASEPAGPSSLSRGVSASSKTQKPTTNPSAPTLSRRAASIGPAPPASDPGVPTLAIKTSIQLALPIPALPAPTEATPAPSSPAESFNKNMVKKNAIKQRLEEAIANGEMPPFCSNCGAIETPTWRKVWTQEKDGAPEWVECSEKPGRVTAIDVLRCDEAGLPLAHRLTKKSLSMDDDRADWQQMLLCNPCGIWLVKSKKHRPQDRWDKDASRLGQNRKRRAGGAGGSRSKKARTQNDMQINPTSEAFSMGDLPTDAMVPIDLSSPEPTTEIANETGDTSLMQARSVTQDTEAGMTQADEMSVTDAAQANTESAQSQDSGTNRSTRVEVLDSSVGNTRRLLFPSPHKDNSPKVLGEVDANVVHSIEYRSPKDLEGEENAVSVPIKDESTVETPTPAPAELPYTPGPARPSTPPPQAKDQDPASEDAFKTPTRPTPSHRPITRSVSRSIKSLRYLMSPMAVEQAPRTPSKSTPRNTLDVKHTPKSNLDVRNTPMLRRSPRFQEEGQITIDPQAFEDMLSDPAFMSGGLDLENIHFDEKDMLEFASFFSTDAAPPSTPPPKSPTPPLPPMEGSYWTRFGLEHIESSLSVKDPKGKGKAQENNS